MHLVVHVCMYTLFNVVRRHVYVSISVFAICSVCVHGYYVQQYTGQSGQDRQLSLESIGKYVCMCMYVLCLYSVCVLLVCMCVCYVRVVCALGNWAG